MARKPRSESTDVIFHVYSRGNYRAGIFLGPGACGSFLASMHEITLRSGWHLYTYALMPNHFHLMLRTPRANLARGMHLLLSGFALRFNGIRDEQGHVFQGRYQAKRMPSTVSAGRLFDYINLNHVRKGLLSVDELSGSELSGVRGLCSPSCRGETRPGEALERFIGYPDSPTGWANYNVHLKKVSLEDPDARIFEAEWTMGEIQDRKLLARNPLDVGEQTGLTEEEVAQLDQRHIEETFAQLLKQAGRTPREIELEHGVSPWKMAIAVQMFRLTTASLPVVVRMLNAGSVSHFSRCLRDGVRPH